MPKYTVKQLKVGTPPVAEVKLTYTSLIKPEDRRLCNTPIIIADVLYEWWDAETIELYELFVVLFLDRRNRLIGLYEHSHGGTSSVTVAPELILAAALKCRANCIVVAHNHPSGLLEPSEADIGGTRRLATLGLLHGVPLLDHLIICSWLGYYSFAEDMPEVLKGYNLTFD